MCTRPETDGVLVRDVCIINVSPVEFGHCLFIPKVELCQPQILTLEAVTSALQIVLLSRSKVECPYFSNFLFSKNSKKKISIFREKKIKFEKSVLLL
jgi:hypothetical protein